MEDVWEANIHVVGGWWMPVSGEFTERSISIEEIRGGVKEMKSSKA